MLYDVCAWDSQRRAQPPVAYERFARFSETDHFVPTPFPKQRLHQMKDEATYRPGCGVNAKFSLLDSCLINSGGKSGSPVCHFQGL